MSGFSMHWQILAILIGWPGLIYAQDLAGEPLVDVAKACPGVVIELRYASTRNIAGYHLYPGDARCLLREGVARRLAKAQRAAQEDGCRIKIWDGYRPPHVQEKLWKIAPHGEFLADPGTGGSLHSWGVAIDATLVDRFGRELLMPTDFDVFTPAAAMKYIGKDRSIARNLKSLQIAMGRGGFLGMHGEWWHFVAKDWKRYALVLPPVKLEPPERTAP